MSEYLPQPQRALSNASSPQGQSASCKDVPKAASSNAQFHLAHLLARPLGGSKALVVLICSPKTAHG